MRILPIRALLSLSILCLVPLGAQSAGEKDVAIAVQHLFDAMQAQDGGAIESLMLSDARIRSVRGEAAPTLSTVQEFVTRITGMKGGLQEKFKATPRVEIRGRMAQLWGEYVFLLGGKADHCGVDSVNLLKTAEGWKISEVDFTNEPCQ